jgi:hypothetical protein
MERRRKQSILHTGSIKVLALNQLSINLRTNDEVEKIGFYSEKISHQLKSAKETVHGLQTVKNHLHGDANFRNKFSGKFGIGFENFDEKIKVAEIQVQFLTHVHEDLEGELVHMKKQSEKLSSRPKKSVKLQVSDDKPPKPSTSAYVPMRNKPTLNLRLHSDEHIDLTIVEDGSASVEDNGSNRAGNSRGGQIESSGGPGGGTSGYFVSPRGTVRLGDFSIGERGLHTMSSFVIGDSVQCSADSEGGGFIDFLEICLLGCGASATVKEVGWCNALIKYF